MTKNRGYKYMTKDNMTRNNTKWGDGVTHEAKGSGYTMCTGGVIHYYENKHIAALMDPITGGYTCDKDCILRSCVAEGHEVTDGLRYGSKKVTTGPKVKQIKINAEQQGKCAIRISFEIFNDPFYIRWGEKWLSGEDRSQEAAGATRSFFRKNDSTYDDIGGFTALHVTSYIIFRNKYSDDIGAQVAEAAIHAGVTSDRIVEIIKDVLRE